MAQRIRRPWIPGPSSRPRHVPDPLDALLKDKALAWNGWAISCPLARALWHRLNARRPTTILELGSGTSTLVLARWAADAGARLTTLEHDPAQHDRTQAALLRHDLAGHADLVLAPCNEISLDGAGRVRFYDHSLSGTYDFAFVDGPPLDLGRLGVLFAVWPHLAPSWELWMKDANRSHEKACLAHWSHHRPFVSNIRQDDRRGIAVLTPARGRTCTTRRAAPPVPYRTSMKNVRPQPDPARFVDATARHGCGRVTVSIPCFDCRDHLRRAVESILAQTYDDLRLIVTSDGETEPPWDILDDIDDPRLVRFKLSRNMGRYFVDDVVLSASDDTYFLIQDADDWSEPDRLLTLMEALCRDNTVASLSSGYRYDLQNGQAVKGRRERFASTNLALGPTYRHLSRHHGLFRSDALRAVGGCYGGFRISYDMLIMNLMLMLGNLSYVDRPLYNRLVRPTSLTMSHETGMRSVARRDSNRRLRSIYEEVYAYYRRLVAGSLSLKVFTEHVRTIAARGKPPGAEELREAEAARLRSILARLDERKDAVPVRMTPLAVEDRRLDWGGWSLSRSGAAVLAEGVNARAPRAIVELGSGSTTALLAGYASGTGARLVSLEHDPSQYLATRAKLRKLGVLHAVDLRLAPLVDRKSPNERAGRFYDTTLGGSFDFALIDGPPLTFGRDLALPMLKPHLEPGWEAWMHDAYRQHEIACLSGWRKAAEFSARMVPGDDRGFWVLSDGPPGRVAASEARRIGITLLTGGRLQLLMRTIDALRASAPGLLEGAHVECLVNGCDAETLRATEAMRFLNRRHVHAGRMWSIGRATSFLMREVAGAPVDFVLHLEDDWEAEALEDGWLARAVALLDTTPAIGQVRLRHHEDRVLTRHEITRRPITWQTMAGFRVSPAAHFTFNPGLVRRTLLGRIFPASGEHEAQRVFLAAGLGTAQLLPGVFRHIGQHESLRSVALPRNRRQLISESS